MRRVFPVLVGIILIVLPLAAQTKRLWVLRSTGEMVEYDPATLAAKQTVKLPAEAGRAPASVDVNHAGQILFAPTVSLPLSQEDATAPHKVWIWNGQAAASIELGVTRKQEPIGSNQAVTDLVPAAFLSADGTHLYWFANEARRLQREDIDLSTTITWKAWRTDLTGSGREELTSTKFPDCRCTTGSCEESCPVGVVWVPDGGAGKFFLMTQFIAGQTSAVYKASTKYDEEGGKWTAKNLTDPLQRVLDASSSGDTIVEAIPDTGCCGWSNQSNDQTFALTNSNKITVFDEQATYKNQDYDVSFLTSNAYLSPDVSRIAMTVTATAQANKPIQLAEQGQANPEESQKIRKALTELPAVVVKSIEEPPKQIAFVPHATLVGWINDREILIVEDHLLAVYNVASGARKKSSVRVEDAAHVFLR
ncbi:MAG TPA: hypothetical protein VKB49_14190 [Candidatus Sulfotelmatobacter sp.]|nr:hypothetical protein [Candidatus Sulfotelmatobacter sp.]